MACILFLRSSSVLGLTDLLRFDPTLLEVIESDDEKLLSLTTPGYIVLFLSSLVDILEVLFPPISLQN